jgi:hypothetical protein
MVVILPDVQSLIKHISHIIKATVDPIQTA